MKKIFLSVLGIFSLMALNSCTDEDYPLYNTGQKDSVFFDYVDANKETATSLDYAFNFEIAQVHTVELPITLMGVPKGVDRKVSIVPVSEETDMKEGIHYQLEETILPANEVKSVVRVNLLRDKDPELQNKAFKIRLLIEENDDLRAVGQNTFDITYSDIRPGKPEWWTDTNSYDMFPTYTFEGAQIFFEYFYTNCPKANKDMFDEMIKKYGEYFVNAEWMLGPGALYRNFLMLNVLIPMYQDTQAGKNSLDWHGTAPNL